MKGLKISKKAVLDTIKVTKAMPMNLA